MIGNEIAIFTCEIAGIEKKITIGKKNFSSFFKNIDLENLNIFKFIYNSNKKSYKFDKILNIFDTI